MSNLSLKTIEELDCALLKSAKYLADMDRFGESFDMHLELGGHLDVSLPTPIARELIAKRQAEITAELQGRRKLASNECVCECKCGKGESAPQGALL